MASVLPSKLTTARTVVAKETNADREAALVRRVQEGDVRAFDSLVLNNRERLLSIVYNLTSNREDAADLTQEAFIKAFRSIHNFKGKSSFYTWLYRIAVNTAYSYLKKHRWKRFFSLENINEEGAAADIIEKLTAANKTEKPAMMAELQEKLNEALQSLSLKHRTVITLFEVEGLSHQEIAEIVGCSEGTVRSRLHYAKQELQGILKDYLG